MKQYHIEEELKSLDDNVQSAKSNKTEHLQNARCTVFP